MERLFRLMGFNVSEDGILNTTSLFARGIANLAVRQGSFIKITRNNFKVK